MSEEEITNTTILKSAPSITLNKLSGKNKYTWNIKLSGENGNDILKEIEEINKVMLDKFGGKK